MSMESMERQNEARKKIHRPVPVMDRVQVAADRLRRTGGETTTRTVAARAGCSRSAACEALRRLGWAYDQSALCWRPPTVIGDTKKSARHEKDT